MGKSFFAANWEKEFKTDVRNIEKGSGLTVSSNKQGNMEVKYRKNGISQTTTIPFVIATSSATTTCTATSYY